MKLIFHPANEVRQNLPVLKWHVPPVRTYEEIAQILAKRGQSDVKAATVGQICTAAINKVARKFMADPVIRTGLGQPMLRLRGEQQAKKA